MMVNPKFKVGDLVRWKQSPKEIGMILDIEGKQIKVIDLGGDFHLQSDWWRSFDWILAEESP